MGGINICQVGEDQQIACHGLGGWSVQYKFTLTSVFGNNLFWGVRVLTFTI